MQRRALLWYCLLGRFCRAVASPNPDLVDLLSKLAAALSEGNSSAFLKPFDRSMADFGKLERNIEAMTSQSDIGSSIALLEKQETAQEVQVTLDWFLELRSKEDIGPYQRRRERVVCRLVRTAKSWKIVSLEPVDFFRPLDQR